ncbi:MAG: YraN family protein [Candidatus Pacebacteria bacterium]|nr:YraN family protein [Candidatus Paceibacterota bacterium]
MAGNKTSELGFFAEHYAAEYLKSKNYKILGHNYRKPWGEIDVIAEKQGIVIFVEVKASKKDVPGFEPELRVDSYKKHRMIRIARTYLSDMHYPDDQPWQMDVVSVSFVKERGVAKIRHYKNIE